MKKDGAFVVLFRDDSKKEVFLVFRSDYPIWGLTGGGIEKGEEPKEAAIREAKEETGFEVKLIKKLGTYEFLNKQRKSIRKTYLFEGRVVSGEFKPEYPGCKGGWFRVDKLPFETIYRAREKIYDTLSFKEPFTKIVHKENSFRDFLILLRHPISGWRIFFHLLYRK